MPEVAGTWVAGTQYVVSGSGGHTIVMDQPRGRAEWHGFKPSELLLAALVGCSGGDFASILAKQRQAVSSIRVRARGEQDAEPPWAYRTIELVFEVRGTGLDRAAVERALNLAVERYCSVGATVRGVAKIVHRSNSSSNPRSPPNRSRPERAARFRAGGRPFPARLLPSRNARQHGSIPCGGTGRTSKGGSDVMNVAGSLRTPSQRDLQHRDRAGPAPRIAGAGAGPTTRRSRC